MQRQHHDNVFLFLPLRKAWLGLTLCCLCLLSLLVSSCARMGNPDGGWYDETMPKVVSTTPEDKGVDVKSQKILINFDEYVKIDNPTENVVISPPQLQAPEIKGQGKRISVQLLDSLKPNTTYTIDFSNAISDNNEGNPLGNYTFSFSTGDHIDTLEVSGYVISAENLEPMKGILVGLYDDLSDTVFKHKPMLRLSRTDSRGHFVIKGIASGKYRAYALQDADGDYVFGQKSEIIAFDHELIEPSFKPDIRQDTTWLDSLHIADIQRVPYTHFLPDNICLRAFNEILTDRHLVKSERKEANHFTLFYSYGDSILPQIQGLNYDANDAFIIDSSLKKDTITYWLKDTALVNQDTLQTVLTHHITDTQGVMRLQNDTLTLLSKQPYAKRLKAEQKAYDTWKKAEDKKKKRGDPYDSIMPKDPLKLNITPNGEMDPDQNVMLIAQEPLNDVDTAYVHLYAKPPKDSLWYREPYDMHRVNNETFMLRAAWKPETEYSLEVDSAAISTIYGLVSGPIKQGLKVRSSDNYGTLMVTLMGMNGKNVIGQLMDNSDKIVKQVFTNTGQLEFFYLKEAKYYLRMVVDDNNNGQWDTGNYDADQQPEAVFYYPEEIECKAKWDVTRSWNPNDTPLFKQKPSAIVQQKADKEKQVQHRNLQRARQLGIDYVNQIKGKL